MSDSALGILQFLEGFMSELKDIKEKKKDRETQEKLGDLDVKSKEAALKESAEESKLKREKMTIEQREKELERDFKEMELREKKRDRRRKEREAEVERLNDIAHQDSPYSDETKEEAKKKLMELSGLNMIEQAEDNDENRSWLDSILGKHDPKLSPGGEILPSDEPTSLYTKYKSMVRQAAKKAGGAMSQAGGAMGSAMSQAGPGAAMGGLPGAMGPGAGTSGAIPGLKLGADSLGKLYSLYKGMTKGVKKRGTKTNIPKSDSYGKAREALEADDMPVTDANIKAAMEQLGL